MTAVCLCMQCFVQINSVVLTFSVFGPWYTMLAVILVSDRFFVLPHLTVAYIYISLYHWRCATASLEGFVWNWSVLGSAAMLQLVRTVWVVSSVAKVCLWMQIATASDLIQFYYNILYQTDDQPRTFYASKLIGVLCTVNQGELSMLVS